MDDTTEESAGQLPVAPISTSSPYFKTITSAGVANDSSTVTMNTSGLGLAPGQFVYITSGSASLYSMIIGVSSGSISIADQWAGIASSTATVNVLNDLNSTNNSPPSSSYPALQNGQFYTLCWDLQNSFDDSPTSPVSYTNIFPVTPTSGQGTPQNAGEIAYLYNHYGTVNIAAEQRIMLSSLRPTRRCRRYQRERSPKLSACRSPSGNLNTGRPTQISRCTPATIAV